MSAARDLVGYGATPPPAHWPGGARIAVQFVVNYEEGAENCVLNGDAGSEAFLSEMVGAQAQPGARAMAMESLYEYGSRAGFWRLHRLFTARALPVTVFGVASALACNPDAVAAMQAADWEIASHGLRWIDYQQVSEHIERAHIAEAIAVHTRITGSRPLGWYQGRTVHIHAKVHLDSSTVLTTQLFFDDSVTDRVFAAAPYSGRGSRDVRNGDDGIFDEALLLDLSREGDGYAGTISFDVAAS